MCKVCFREKSDTAPIVIGCSISPTSNRCLQLSWVKIWWCRKYFVPLHCYQETP